MARSVFIECVSIYHASGHSSDPVFQVNGEVARKSLVPEQRLRRIPPRTLATEVDDLFCCICPRHVRFATTGVAGDNVSRFLLRSASRSIRAGGGRGDTRRIASTRAF